MRTEKELRKRLVLAVAGVLFLFIFIVVLNMGLVSATFVDDGTTAQTLYDCGYLNTTNAVYTMNQSVSSAGTCLNIMANNVTIDCGGNTISYSQSILGYGINSSRYNLTTVRNCDIVAITTAIGSRHAIYYSKSSNGTILNNTLTINDYDGSDGIYLESNSSFNTISNNAITTNDDSGNGIYLDTGSSFNTISNNTVVTNGASGIVGGYGIYLNSNSNSNILSNNTITIKLLNNGQFTAGIFLSSSTNNTLRSNKANTSSTNSYLLVGTTLVHYNNSIDDSNLAEGLRVNYTYNAENLVLEGVDFTQYGQVIFAACRNITITNSNFSSDSLSLFNTDNSTISNNIINSNKGIGVWLYSSSNNTLDNNNITNSNVNTKGYGIYLYSGSKFNTISNNTIKPSSSPYGYGIYLHSGPLSNIISNNTITTSSTYGDGVYLLATSKNIIDSNTIATSSNMAYGIIISGSHNHTINNNIITTLGTESYGIFFFTGTNNTLTNNKVNSLKTNSYVFYGGLASNYDNSIDSSNFAEGLQVNFTCNADNLIVDGVDFTQSGQVIFCNGKNITITNSNFSSDSLNLFGINASTISNNTINTSTGNGLYLSGNSNGNTIDNNVIITSGIEGRGIDLYSWSGNSINNNITNNIITTLNSSAPGIYLNRASYYNNIINNIITTSSHGIFFESYPSNNNINNNTINTSGGNGYGIYLFSATNNNNLNNNTITTLGSSGYGISLYDCDNNNIKDNEIVTNGTSAYGIHLYADSENNTFSGMNVRTNGTGAYAIYLSSVFQQTPSYSFVVRDSILNASRAQEFWIVSSIGGGEWNFTNVTRANGRPINITWQTGGNGTLNMHWYMDAYVHSGANNLSGANVTSYDNQSALAFSNLTGSSGRIRKTLLEYTRNETSGTNYTRYSPYNLTVVLIGYSSYYNSSINLSNNVFMDIELGCGCPVGSDWIVSLNCTMIDSICNMPSYKVVCTSGSLTMSNYTIIADKVITPIGHGCLFLDNRSRVMIGS
jgi:parallel beta-helix repeat protein